MEKLASIKEEGLKQIEACEDLAQLQNLRVLYLGKKGPIQGSNEIYERSSKEERPAFGQQVNEIKSLLQEKLKSEKLF